MTTVDVPNLVGPFASWLAKCGVVAYVVDTMCSIVYPPELVAQAPASCPLENAFENFTQALQGESVKVGQQLGKRAVEVRYEPIETTEGIIGAVATVIDQTENEERIAEMAMQDVLTGLPNRRRLNHELQAAAARADRGDMGFSVHLIDLDFFKEVNDSYGHSVGDQLLKQVGERLETAVRSKSDLAARLGGDEFAVIQHNVKDSEDCGLLAEKIISTLSQPYNIPNIDKPVVIGASMGIAIYPGDGETVSQLIDNADLALYESKNSGKKQYQFFEPELQEAIQVRMQMSRELRTALVEGQFYLNFQPILDLASDRCSLAEVLLRWRHPEKGMISPSEFIPLAEDTGAIIALTYYVIQRLCLHIEELGPAAEGMTFAINLPGQILKEDFVDRLMCILRAHEISPCQLKLEITEHTALKDTERVQQTMKQLTALGFDFAIDDFGTGYSSLRNLQTFAFSKVKIDKCFIDNIETESGAEVVKSIIDMSKSFGLEVVAEGIENWQQLAVLRGQGCDSGQGYLFSRPLDFDSFRQYIHDSVAPIEEWPDTWMDSEVQGSK